MEYDQSLDYRNDRGEVKCKPGNVKCGDRCFPPGHKCGGKGGSSAKKMRLKKMQNKVTEVAGKRRRKAIEVQGASKAMRSLPEGSRAQKQAKKDFEQSTRELSSLQKEGQSLLSEINKIRG